MCVKRRIGENMVELWEKQEYETPRQYAMFCFYRDLGFQRSFKKAAAAANRRPNYIRVIQTYSKKNRWVERCAAYDLLIEEKKKKNNEDKIQEMKERHIQRALDLQQKVLERLERLNPNELSPADCVKMLDVSVKIERLSRDVDVKGGKLEITNNVAIQNNINKEEMEQEKLSKLSIEELEEYEQLVRKLNNDEEDIENLKECSVKD